MARTNTKFMGMSNRLNHSVADVLILARRDDWLSERRISPQLAMFIDPTDAELWDRLDADAQERIDRQFFRDRLWLVLECSGELSLDAGSRLDISNPLNDFRRHRLRALWRAGRIRDTAIAE